VKVILFGATGMVGGGTLIECLDDQRVGSILVVGRRSAGVRHPKVTEILHDDPVDYTPLRSDFAGSDACFFCAGVSAAGISEEVYRRVTYDLTIAAARAVLAGSPAVTFCYISGAGTDSTGRARVMWARVKGMTENVLLDMPFRRAFMLRPGFIQPLRGVRSRTPSYRAFYTITGPLYPLLRRIVPRYVTTTVNVGRALIRLAAEGFPRRILDTADINQLADLAVPHFVSDRG
jgi:uncharacterized protein YbjT (DUF2867 family)